MVSQSVSGAVICARERLTEERRKLERLRSLRAAGGDGERLVEVFDQLAQVLRVHRVADEPPTVQMLVEQRVGAAEEVLTDNNAFARCEDRQHCVDRCEP